MSELNDCYDQNLEVEQHFIQLQSASAIDLSFHQSNQPNLQDNENYITVTNSFNFIQEVVNQIQLHFSDLLIQLDSTNIKNTKGEKKKFKLQKIKVGKQCSICQAPIRKNAKIPKLKCKHVFHQKCLEKWIKMKSNCPMCRIQIE